MSLLCLVLSVFLLRRPPPVPPESTSAPPEHVPTPEERRSVYRAWPMFEGWPLPQLPPTHSAPGSPEPPRDAPPAPRDGPCNDSRGCK
ncbi:hypothetical protein [Myxococcus sp. Y35]|uniref:hypothetical protein n=1 Tax=Pseudomyxococcus flavus TaxID=3115648 RepID=UPI003CED5B30